MVSMILSQRQSPVEDILKISFTLSAIKEYFCGLLTLDDGKKNHKACFSLYRNFPLLIITTTETNKQKAQTKPRPYQY